MTTLAGRMLGRYRLDELLGRGGMAEVYRAADSKLARTVAVKVILPAHAGDPNFVERFLREARLVASLEHPNILPVYDFGEEDGAVWLVMPYLDGGTLRDRMAGGPVPLAQAVAWIGQLAEGLDAAHAAGILHRDVKPANVLVGKGERLVLADFGIAKVLEAQSGLTVTGMVVGTPVYMAPEQAQGRPATAASDRYALAIIAYELLSGRPPFAGESALALMHQHVTTPAPALSTIVRGLPSGLDSVFEKALAKDPQERPATCRALADALATFAPTGGYAVVKAAPISASTAQQTAATLLQRQPAVSAGTPPPSLTSAATVLTRVRRRGVRRTLALGGVGAAVALAAIYVWRRTPAESPHPSATLAAAPTPTAAIPPTPITVPPPPAPVSVVELPATTLSAQIAAPVVPSPPRAATAAKPTATPQPPPETRDRESDGELEDGGATTLADAHRRLDPGRVGKRPTREDFSFAAAAAERTLEETPRNQEARFLLDFARAGVAYMDGRDREAAADLEIALLEGRKLGNREARRLWLLQRGQRNATGDREWALALALGDPKRVAGTLLEKEIAERPGEARPYIARSMLDLMDGKSAAAIADARTAHEKAERPAIRSAAAELLGEELARAGEKSEALGWLRRAVADAPTEVRARIATRAANVARRALADEAAARELFAIACRSGSEDACREIGAETAARPRLRPMRRRPGLDSP